ncbi:MAG: PIN domain-containing protein [Thermomicrobiales bacterium]
MTLFLLDSNIVIDVLGGDSGALRLIDQLDDAGAVFGACDIVLAEVLTGVHERDRPLVLDFLRNLRFLASTREIGEQAGLWRHDYARRGIALSVPDLLIAATALVYDASLITRNLRHFPMLGVRALSPD